MDGSSRRAPAVRPGGCGLYPYLHEIRIHLRPLKNGRDLAVRHCRAVAAELRTNEGRRVQLITSVILPLERTLRRIRSAARSAYLTSTLIHQMVPRIKFVDPSTT